MSVFEQAKFFVPLAMTSFMTTITHSLFNAGVARLASPEIYLSAFAVAKSLMQLLQSPVIMVRQAVTALVDDKRSYYKVRKFIILLAMGVVTFFAIFAFTGLASWIIKNLMGIEGRILAEAVVILRVLVLFPVAVALRSFNQGIAIKFRMTPLITLATIARISFVGIIVFYTSKLATILPGGVVAGLMFLGAICVEGVVAFLGVRLSIKNVAGGLERMKQEWTGITRMKHDHRSSKTIDPTTTMGKNQAQILTNRLIFNFFLPLIITSLMRTLAKPIINTGLASTSSPEIALAAYAVGWNLGMIVVSPLMMFHQVSLNFIEGELNFHSVKKFAIYLSGFISLVMILISFTDIGYFILRNLIGATEDISLMALDVLRIMCFLPVVIVTREFKWGILMKKRLTRYIGRAKIVNLVTLTVAIGGLSLINLSNPAVIGAIGMVIAQTMELASLYVGVPLGKY